MITALHIILGVLTPHLGVIISGVFGLLKAHVDVHTAELEDEEELDEEQLKTQLAEYKIQHLHQNWADRLAPIIKLIVVLAILGLFAYAEFTNSTWEDEWRQGMVSFVLAHAMSQGVPMIRAKLKAK